MRATDLDARPLGYEQWLALPESNLPCEVVDGRLIMSPTPTYDHQRAVLRLAMVFEEAATEGFAAAISPLDWIISRDPLHVRQPDVMVVETATVTGRWLTHPPVIAVEVLSPTSRERDLVTKRRIYAETGLPWYWIVSLEVPQILVLRNEDGVFVEHAVATGDELLELLDPFPLAVRPTDLV